MSVMIQLRNVPDDLHKKLKARAALEGRSLSDYLIGKVGEIVARPTEQELLAGLAKLRPAKPGFSTAAMVRAMRDERARAAVK